MATKRWLALGLIAVGVACADHHTGAPSDSDSSRTGSRARATHATGSAGTQRAASAAGTSASSMANVGSASNPCEPRGPCPDIDLDSAILFSPVYSAYDGVHVFSVPVTVLRYTEVKWETDREDLVELKPIDTNTVMIETLGAGTARIIARVGPLSGSTVLTITEFEPEEWAIGERLYAGGAQPQIDRNSLMFQDDLSCGTCHSGAADALSYETTPQQLGGYSDGELSDIITMGIKPPQPGWRSAVPMFIYTMLHTLSLSDAETRALLAYLRSITPASAGERGFGGL